MNRTLWNWARPLCGAAILAALVWRLGTDPFVDALGRIDSASLAAAAGIAVVTTGCCAWRWSLVARGLGVPVPIRAAVAAYYRSQFLNSTLPGGVVGDVERAVRHGRAVGNVGRGFRAVVWERSAGQVVQLALTVVLLLLLPSPVRATLPTVLAVAGTTLVLGILVARLLPDRAESLWTRVRRVVAGDLRDALLAPWAWPGILLASTIVVVGHTVTFLIAARTAGSTASLGELLPLALLVLMAMAVPANIAGWGPREGVAAWAFAVAGLGAAQGVATAVVYGVMALVATLPGAVVLAAALLQRHSDRTRRTARQPEGVARG